MITKAKVSASAVKAFEQSASNIRDYSDKFDRGIYCLEQLLQIRSLDLRSECEQLAVHLVDVALVPAVYGEELEGLLRRNLGGIKAQIDQFRGIGTGGKDLKGVMEGLLVIDDMA